MEVEVDQYPDNWFDVGPAGSTQHPQYLLSLSLSPYPIRRNASISIPSEPKPPFSGLQTKVHT
jgi:hypothetical protein